MGIGNVLGKGNDASASDRPPEDGRDRRAGPGDGAGDGVPREEIPDHIFPALDDQDDADDDLSYIHPIVGKTDHTPESEKTVTRIEVPVRTIVTVALALFLIWLLIQVWGILLQVFLAFLLATALLPLVKRLENRGMPKGIASSLVFLGLIAMIAGFFGIIVPPLVEQGQNIVTNAPEYLNRFEGFIERYPSLEEQYERLRDQGLNGNGEGTEQGAAGAAAVPVNQVVEVSADIVTRLANTFFVLILTFYLMLEGERTWRFLSRYFTPGLRYRMRKAYPEITHVVSGYVVGQAINSASFGIFAFITLTILGVPETLLLAVLAAVFDAVPIVGVPVATIPAVLIALTVSWQTAAIVLAAYLIYQQFENYVMVPRVFGNTLQVSSLSILVGVLIGGQLLGVIGIILS
ncbi:MAG TPA: AI-2E family transporter, partial [Thermomicrobiales bacterium]|nr:AI-2E family transporter [Thermomicrobiales bacterium]